jgi:hypothetical protein
MLRMGRKVSTKEKNARVEEVLTDVIFFSGFCSLINIHYYSIT